MKSFELVIFDCDGVLVDSETITNALMIAMLKPYGIQLSKDEYVSRYVGTALTEFVKQIGNEYKVNFPKDFMDNYHKRAKNLIRTNLKPVTGIQDLLKRITLPYCVASNSDISKVQYMLETTNLYRYFEGKIYSASNVSKPKPAPDVYLHAAMTNKVKPENCLVIEDTPTGIKSAKAAGMTVYGYAGLFQANILSSSGAEKVFDCMENLFI